MRKKVITKINGLDIVYWDYTDGGLSTTHQDEDTLMQYTRHKIDLKYCTHEHTRSSYEPGQEWGSIYCRETCLDCGKFLSLTRNK